jgi:hypothetical protein
MIVRVLKVLKSKWGVGGVGVEDRGGLCSPLSSNIPRSALCATLDTYDFSLTLKQNIFR